ncbi:hypothetical protein OVY01_21740 [Robbsia sp. Bb-Pol-6]|uniref:Uncharacterized protein n=1 Tax=Robbsia betulipollinis TaxID=2981849 RepID=A0ABT3ZTA9_9BURK|nr:hypothetical protein [Robbsia betulipollinis]MCY0389768.1 hypothetical protein [Robbsia betulipollinis]
MSTVDATSLKYPDSRSPLHLDAALLYVMVHKIENSDAMLWDRIDDAKDIIDQNAVIRDLRRKLDDIIRTGEKPELKNVYLEFSVGPKNTLRSKVDNLADGDGKYDKNGNVRLTSLLHALGENATPKNTDDLKAIRKNLADRLSNTESQQAQVLLQDALQKSREIVSTAGGLIKTRHDSKLTILNKI